MKKKIIGLIPVRLQSKRLPKKALLEIEGIPMIVHTYQRAIMSKLLDDLYVCTDSDVIIKLCKTNNIKFIKTSKKHKNGTERIAEACKKFKSVSLIVDIQGDEPLISPEDIDKVILFHNKNQNFDIVVPYQRLKNEENKNIVKIVSSNKKIIYFSRSCVPTGFNKKELYIKKHHSIISFKKKTLIDFAKLPQGEIEKIEGIELMRALENNFKVGTFLIKSKAFAVDVIEDYLKASLFMKKDFFLKKYKNKIIK